MLTAFVDAAQAADVLALTIATSRTNRLIGNFGNLPNGTSVKLERVMVPRQLRVRYGAGEGIIPLQHFTLWAERHAGRPHGLDVISFFPTLVV